MAAAVFNPFDAVGAAEVLLAAGRHAEAFGALADFVEQMQAQFFLRNMEVQEFDGNPYPLHAGLCERFANAWGGVLLADGFDIARAPLTGVLRNLNVVHDLVHGTAAGNLDGCIGVLRARTNGNFTLPTVARLLLLWVPGSRMVLDHGQFHPHLPELVTSVAVATVAGLVMCSPESHRAREAAIAFLVSGAAKATDYDRIGFSRALISAWMLCSYACAPDRHQVKRLLNDMISRLPVRQALPRAPVSRADERPVMIVPLEHFVSTHAMYRCYAPVIEACRRDFFLVALVVSKRIDAEASTLFDAVHLIDRECLGADGSLDIGEVEALANSYSPAIVFHPSIGMQDYNLLIANRRLAPVQAMTYGHPATSGMGSIDYGLTEEQWIIDPAHFTERMVPLPKGALRYVMHAEDIPDRLRRERGDVLRVAIPSMAQKWTWPFLEALARVRRHLGARVQFEFFSGLNGYNYPAAMNAVLRALPNAVVHPALTFPDYIRALALCDVHAATFPFGGTNSVFDSLGNGLPVVCLAPTDISGAQDSDFLQRVGLPGWLVAPDVEGFVDNLVRLATEPGLLDGLRAQLADRERIRSIFVQGGQPEAYAEALRRLAGGD